MKRRIDLFVLFMMVMGMVLVGQLLALYYLELP